jgi:A/G-specific adenine glycosylase
MFAEKINKRIGERMLDWYDLNKRDLPWRRTKNPFNIWLSEIILQQTRIDQGLPYYENFAAQYPDVCSLARADEQEVLRLWQGLGYYSRARNLHACAKAVCKKHKGIFPDAYDELIKLPGIGSYTAAAIASIAFGKRVPVIDGNVLRVITRLYGIDSDITKSRTIKDIRSILYSIMPDRLPDQFNQAIMEFGARQCTPSKPQCQNCVLKEYCMSYRHGLQDLLPVKKKGKVKKDRHFYYFVIQLDDRVFMRKRGDNDIWRGLYEFYLIENDIELSLDEVRSSFSMQVGSLEINESEPHYYQKHVLSHQNIYSTFFRIYIDHSFNIELLLNDGYISFNPKEIQQLPKSVLIDKYLQDRFN